MIPPPPDIERPNEPPEPVDHERAQAVLGIILAGAVLALIAIVVLQGF